MGRGPAGAYVAPFYGVSVLLRSLLLALRAWQASQGAFTFIDLLSRRPVSYTGSAAERLPKETWDHIRRSLRDSQYAEDLGRVIDGDQDCVRCWREKGTMEGRGHLLGELWEDFQFDPKDPQRCCKRCGKDVGRLHGKSVGEPFAAALPTLQHFLRLHGLHLPTHLLRRNDADTYEGADDPFTTFLALDAVNRPKPPLGADTVRRKRVSARSVSEQTDDVFELDTRVPPGADEMIKAFVRDWHIEVVEEEMGVLKLRVVGKAEKKQAGEPRWTIFFFCESGEDEYH